MLLIRRPVHSGTSGQVEYTNDELCFERVDGATTTFHVRADTPEGRVDWRFEWPAPIATAPEPAHLQHAVLVMIGLYAETSKPIAVGAADR